MGETMKKGGAAIQPTAGSNSEAAPEDPAPRWWERHLFRWIFLVVVAVWVLYALAQLLPPLLPAFRAGQSLEDRGLFGDSFGALNALFSGLAFAAVAVTLYYQRRDLALQREDLRIQQKMLAAQLQEMKDQRGEMEKQREALIRQATATIGLAHATERAAADGLRPYVVVSPMMRDADPTIYLRIANVGKTAAEELRLSMAGHFYQYGMHKPERDLAALSAFTETIYSLPSGLELRFALAIAPHLFSPKLNREVTPLEFAVRAEYSHRGARFSELTVVDLRPFERAEFGRDELQSELAQIRHGLLAIQQAIERAASRPGGRFAP